MKRSLSKVLSLVGARPQFVKEALVGEAARTQSAWEHILVHSGQHYDLNMSDVFFKELGIPLPKHHLGIGSGSHGTMTAAALSGMEKVLEEEKPDALIVYGDTNTTLAGALAASKLHIPVIHIEAGIRMSPKTMPEEINRVLVDRISTLMCCCSTLGSQNLKKEGITEGVSVTGDVMYDLFLRMRPKFTPERTCENFGVTPGHFVVTTLHRDYNVDDPGPLGGIIKGLSKFSKETEMPLLLPLHPRTQKRIAEFGLADSAQGLTIIPPIGYFDLMSLVTSCALVITDSGGLQKESYYAGKRTVVIMPDTGWRELADCGWNLLSPPEADAVMQTSCKALEAIPFPAGLYGKGNAAQRIVDYVAQYLN